MSKDIQSTKVALIGPVFPYRGGIAHYTTSLAKTFQSQGHQLLLVSFKRQYPLWLYPGDSDKDPSTQSFEVDYPNYWIDSLNPITWVQSFWRIRAFAPKVIVLQWWTTFFAPIWLTIVLLNKVFLDAELVLICHNVLPHEERRLDRWIVWLLLGQSSHIVVQSDDEQGRVAALLPHAAVSVVPHPVHNIMAADIFTAEQMDPIEARQALGLQDEQFVLLFFGMIRAYKGLRELLYALAIVREQYPPIQLLIAGEFWEDKREYLTLIKSLELEGHVKIDDRYIPNENVASYYAAADLLVAPYRHHTGSAVIQVAAALQLPLITLNDLTVESRGAILSTESTLFNERVDCLATSILSRVESGVNPIADAQLAAHPSGDSCVRESSWYELADKILATVA